MAEFEVFEEALTISDIAERSAPPPPARGTTEAVVPNPLAIRENWRNDSLCGRLRKPMIMRPGPGDVKGLETAKGICARCPVKLPCFIELVTNPPPQQALTGITAGLSTRQQKAAIQAHRMLIEYGELQDFITSSQFAADVAINSTFDQIDLDCIS